VSRALSAAGPCRRPERLGTGCRPRARPQGHQPRRIASQTSASAARGFGPSRGDARNGRIGRGVRDCAARARRLRISERASRTCLGRCGDLSARFPAGPCPPVPSRISSPDGRSGPTSCQRRSNRIIGASPSATAASTSSSGPARVPEMELPAGRAKPWSLTSAPVNLSHTKRSSAEASPSRGMTAR
jgi:hypothetical protein